MEPPANDKELANAIGTDRKSLRRWRKQYPEDCPTTRDPAQWRKFMEANLLGPFSAQRQYGEDAAPPTSPAPSAEGKEWNRFQSLFPVLEAMHSAYLRGEIHAASYLYLGPATLVHIKAISELWGTDIAPDGWEAIWAHVEKQVRQQLAADDAARAGVR
jgi:hypothetical protein